MFITQKTQKNYKKLNKKWNKLMKYVKIVFYIQTKNFNHISLKLMKLDSQQREWRAQLTIQILLFQEQVIFNFFYKSN